VAVQPRNNHLTGVHLIGVYLTGVHFTGVHLTGVYLMGVHFIGVYLMGVSLIDVYFMDMYMFPNPKKLWGKPPDPPFYKRWSICGETTLRVKRVVEARGAGISASSIG